MSEPFISVLDVLQKEASLYDRKKVTEEIFQIWTDLKKTMDGGVSSEDAKRINSLLEAAAAARKLMETR